LYVMITIISAAGRPLVSLAISAAALLANVCLNYALIPWKGLPGAATGATAAMLIGVVVAGGFLKVRYGRLLPMASAARILLSAAVVYGASLVLPHGSKITGLAELGAVSILYFASLLATGELGKAEVLALRKIVKG
ncbi:MAG: polysaccharide biosynthesis C-terminal domain-containing protein, partial [Blastocatellia bacterium]